MLNARYTITAETLSSDNAHSFAEVILPLRT